MIEYVCRDISEPFPFSWWSSCMYCIYCIYCLLYSIFSLDRFWKGRPKTYWRSKAERPPYAAWIASQFCEVLESLKRSRKRNHINTKSHTFPTWPKNSWDPTMNPVVVICFPVFLSCPSPRITNITWSPRIPESAQVDQGTAGKTSGG
jgi:hypothetical protein